MKELSIEEKAEAYDKAIKRAKKYLGYSTLTRQEYIERVFPELIEDKDERIIKEIIQFLQLPHPQFVGKRNHEEWITWLEKQGKEKVFIPKFKVGDIVKSKSQPMLDPRTIISIDNDCYRTNGGGCIGFAWEKDYELIEQKPTNIVTILDNYFANTPKEQQDKDWEELKHLNNFGWKLIGQKPAEWSEEDEYQINTILHGLDLKRALYKKEGNQVEEERYSKQYSWLKSIKDRIIPQPQKEWSEEDEEIINEIDIAITIQYPYDTTVKIENWLNFLKYRYTWMPDSSMLVCLEYAIKHINKEGDKKILSKLLDQLKKLRKE